MEVEEKGEMSPGLRFSTTLVEGIMTETYKWHEVYKAALLETDWTKIERKIQAAENGIGERLHEFSLNHGGTPEENQAIVDALRGLDILRKEVAAWNGSQRAS
jgi:hypothetical protein